MDHLLEVRDLTVGLRQRGGVNNVVDGVSFGIAPGEALGMVGESGSGKTTTGLALLRLTPPASRQHVSGQVLFDGRDVMRMNDSQLRDLRGREISMVLQDPFVSLNPVLTIGNQVGEAIAAHTAVSRRQRELTALEALRQVRISAPEARLRSYPHEMSGGMRQRVVGAIALASRPRLLIADEPTTSLDVTTQAQYLSLLKDLQRELGMALLVITHDFGVIARMCERVCVMYAGQIVETAPVRTIFRAPAHWYTAALIDSVPRLTRRTHRLKSIGGAPPRIGQMPGGCRFAPRCPNAQERCRQETPPTVSLAPHHQVRCWYPQAGQVRA